MTTRDHHCHAWRCSTRCAPRFLMCPRHWSLVPPELQREVVRTFRARGPRIDATWAPWWRAQERAICAVAVIEGMPKDLAERRIAHAERIAAQFESRSA